MENLAQNGGTTTERPTSNTSNTNGTIGDRTTERDQFSAGNAQHGDRDERKLHARTLIDEAENTLRQGRESYNALGMFDVVKSIDKIIAECDRLGR